MNNNNKKHLGLRALFLWCLSLSLSYAMDQEDDHQDDRANYQQIILRPQGVCCMMSGFDIPADLIRHFAQHYHIENDIKVLSVFRVVCKSFHFCSQKMDNVLPNTIRPSNGWLLFYPNLTSLNLSKGSTITDEAFIRLTALRSLDLGGNNKITNRGLTCLTNLTSLNLYSNRIITDDAITLMTTLVCLNLGWNNKITNRGLTCLKNLTSLRVFQNYVITDDAILLMTTLRSLDLRYNTKITNRGIVSLTNLTSLTHEGATMITVEGLIPLINLKLIKNNMISDETIIFITTLRNLNLAKHSTI